jgi:CBS domain-containing protein
MFTRVAALRSSRTLDEDGAHSNLLVRCAPRDEGVPLAECVACAWSAGLRVGPRPGDASVHCAATGDEADAPSCDSRGPTDRLTWSPADRTPLSVIMRTHVVCVRPSLELSVVGAAFLKEGMSGAPVVDDLGRPIGVVSKTDLIRWIYEGDAAGSSPKVADVMQPIAFCLRENDSVAKAAALMGFEHIHRVPVVSATGQVVGIVSSLDVLCWLARDQGYVLHD